MQRTVDLPIVPPILMHLLPSPQLRVIRNPVSVARTIAVTLLLIVLCISDAAAQQKPRFEIKRTRRDSMPVRVQLYAGYNGMSDPSEQLQEYFEGTGIDPWSGVALGGQVFIPIDTVVVPLWVGVDANFHRIGKRYLGLKHPMVAYISDGSPVPYEETLSAWAGSVLVGFEVTRRISLHLGGGAQFFRPSHSSVVSPIRGDMPSATVYFYSGAVNFGALVYEHGSIDIQVRAIQGIGAWGSFQVQSLLCFTFNF